MTKIQVNSTDLSHPTARFISMCLFLVMCFMLFLDQYPSSYILSVMVLASVIIQIIMLFRNKTVYNSGLLMVFYAYTVLVHNGFVIAYFFDKKYITFQSSASMAFVNNQYYSKAIIIANIIIFAFVFSVDFVYNDYSYEKNSNANEQHQEYKGAEWADVVSILLIFLGTAYLGYLVYSNGLWNAGYAKVMSITNENGVYSHLVIITSLAIAILISSGTKRGIKIGLGIYLFYSILHFAIGNRGEVFYAAIVCFALYSIRFKTIKAKHVIVVGVAVVILIPFVRIARELKLDSYTLNPFSSFLDVLCEEGLEISPFTYTVQYLENGHGHVFGMTYINYICDFLLRRIGLTSPFWEEKNMVRAFMPYKGMGYTMVCELYYNFGVVGAVVLFGLIGRWIKWLDKKSYCNELSNKKRVFYSMLMVELINLTRNDCSTLPVYFVYCLVILLVYRLAAAKFK